MRREIEWLVRVKELLKSMRVSPLHEHKKEKKDEQREERKGKVGELLGRRRRRDGG